MKKSVELSLLEKLRRNGERITDVKRELVAIITKNSEPLSATEILRTLKKRGILANKTTIYRQLSDMVAQNLLREVNLSDKNVRYELTDALGHHHHLVCEVCKKIEDIDFPDDLKRQEKLILRSRGFAVKHHSLEFFGLCKNCRK